jgi:UPF0176 protein
MFTVAALYKFAPLDDPAALRQPLLDLCQRHQLCGTLLVAREGINGTIAGEAQQLNAVIAQLRALPGCANLDVKYSAALERPFKRMKVRVKREIVTMKAPGIDPSRDVGTYIDPAAWNAVIDDPDTIVIDTRNAFEVGYGSFEGAIDPGTRSFGEFPDWWRAHADKFVGKRIAMFCTGGIRCEKSTAFLRAEGVRDVVHLKGGILSYLEQIPETDSRWHGGCFVFDERVSVGHGLIELGEHSA